MKPAAGTALLGVFRPLIAPVEALTPSVTPSLASQHSQHVCGSGHSHGGGGQLELDELLLDDELEEEEELLDEELDELLLDEEELLDEELEGGNELELDEEEELLLETGGSGEEELDELLELDDIGVFPRVNAPIHINQDEEGIESRDCMRIRPDTASSAVQVVAGSEKPRHGSRKAPDCNSVLSDDSGTVK